MLRLSQLAAHECNKIYQPAASSLRWTTSAGAVPPQLYQDYLPLAEQVVSRAKNLLVSHRDLCSAIGLENSSSKIFGGYKLDTTTLAVSSSTTMRVLLAKYRTLAFGMAQSCAEPLYDHWRRYCAKALLAKPKRRGGGRVSFCHVVGDL